MEPTAIGGKVASGLLASLLKKVFPADGPGAGLVPKPVRLSGRVSLGGEKRHLGGPPRSPTGSPPTPACSWTGHRVGLRPDPRFLQPPLHLRGRTVVEQSRAQARTVAGVEELLVRTRSSRYPGPRLREQLPSPARFLTAVGCPRDGAQPDGWEYRVLAAYRAQLLDAVRTKPDLGRLATNPLMCGLICALHRDRRGYLPHGRKELYESALSMLLTRRDRERDMAVPELSEEPQLQLCKGWRTG